MACHKAAIVIAESLSLMQPERARSSWQKPSRQQAAGGKLINSAIIKVNIMPNEMLLCVAAALEGNSGSAGVAPREVNEVLKAMIESQSSRS